MAKNFVCGKGTVIPVAAPADVLSGRLVVIGSLYGVAQHDALSGQRVEIEVPAGAVYTLQADTNLQIDVGDRVFWDSTNSWVDKTLTAQTCVGVAVPLDTLASIAKVTAGTTVRVLVGAATAAGA